MGKTIDVVLWPDRTMRGLLVDFAPASAAPFLRVASRSV